MPEPLWEAFTAQVGGLAQIVLQDAPGDDTARAEGLRYLLRFLAAGIAACVEHDDTEHPELGTLIENRRSWGLDNPDTKYSFTRVRPGARYRVHGAAGTATELELQVDSGHFADGRFADWECLRRWRRGDGSLEVGAGPPGEPGGTVELTFTAPPAAGHLHVREYFGDWDREVPAVLCVENLDAPYPPDPLAFDDMAARMELLGLWLTAGARCWAELGRALASGEPGPVTPFVPPGSATGLGGQAYGMGPYRCAPHEAVVLELEPPECRYWSVSLATWFWESADISNRQCSLNHTQAVVDPDGVARLVLAHRDPGVANWIDAAGHERGTLALRLLDAASLPTLTPTVVPLDDLHDRLGPGAQRVTPEQRAEVLRRRRDAVVRRYRR